MASKFRIDIQVIRGIALISVLLFHAKASFFPYGYLGVDVFFVVSGFVVTPLILQIFSRDNSISEVKPRLYEFYKRRFLRLAPALAATILFTLALIFFFGPIQDHRKIFFQGLFSVFGVANLGAIFFSGDYFTPHPNAYIHTWSLSVEEQFYLLLPLIFLVFLKIRNKRIDSIKSIYFFISFFSIVLFLIPSFMDSIYALFFGSKSIQFHFYSPITRAWQFTFGGLAYLTGSRLEIRDAGIRKTSGRILGLILLLLLFNPIHVESKLVAVLATFTCALSIYFRAGDFLPNSLKRNLAWLGNRSYSIYLLHLPLIYLAKYSPIFGPARSQNRFWQSLIAVSLSILFGSFSYTKIENRYRRTSQNRNVRNISRLSYLSFLFIPSLILSILIVVPYQGRLGDSNLPPSNAPVPWERDKSCAILKNDSSIDKNPCFYPAASSRHILLLGDSHAASYAEVVKKIADQNRINLHISTYSDCPFLLSTENYSENGNVAYFSAGCLQHNQKMLHLIQSKKISLVFYAQRARIEDGDKEIVASLSKLETLGTRVIVIGMNPEYVPVTTILGNFINGNGSFNAKVLSVDQNWKNLIGHTGIQYIDTFSKLCPSNICSTRRGSRFLFFDDNHLSEYGASQNKAEIQDALSAHFR
jgi:peptidoglycan/LPS O-acetylase OafA/YrhL